MKKEKVIIDTGPLVAYINKSDKFHEWAIRQFARLKPPVFTCESVISESCFLLRNLANGPDKIMSLLERKLVLLPFTLGLEIRLIKRLIDKYKNIPMSVADACLVRMSEQIADSRICTLDSDFTIYRKESRKVIPVIMPDNLKG